MPSGTPSTPAPRGCSRRQAMRLASQTGLAACSLAGASAATPPDAAPAPDQNAATSKIVQVTDFQRSCLRFRIDTTKKPLKTVSRKPPMTLNNVRFALDARAVLTHKPSGRVYDYVLTASCKSEQVWVARDIWHQPNADMCMLAGRDEFVVFKRWDKVDKGVLRYPASLGVQPERQREDPAEVFDRFSIDLATRPGRLLENLDAVLATLFAATPVVAHTEYESPSYRVLLEYPVKCANFSERERYYQVDTGPVLLPDIECEPGSLLDGCRLAYVAHNCPHWAEFIVCVPTPLTNAIKVHHYSQRVRIDRACNRLFALDVPGPS